MLKNAMRLLLLLVLSLCLAVTGCAGAGPTATLPVTTPTTGQEEIDPDATLSLMGIWSPITATHGNPFLTGFPLHPSIYCWDAAYDAQVFDAENPFYPLLAESYTIDDATKTVKLTLKPGLLWSDGVPLTIEDYRANLALRITRDYVWDFIDSMTITGERTIEVKMSRYNIILLTKVLNCAIALRYTDYKEVIDLVYDIIDNDRFFDEKIQRWRISTDGGKKYVKFNSLMGKIKPDITKIPVTGPFTFTSVTNDEIIMTRNENYWNVKEVKFKTIQFNKITSTENTVLLTKAGELDMDGTAVTPEITTQLELLFPAMRTMLKPIANQQGIAFNFEKYPVNIPEVRKAIAMAIDRSILVDVRKPLGRPGDIYNSGIAQITQDKGTYTDASFMKTLTSYDYDPDKASALLESIGWKKINGKWANEKGEPVKLQLNSGGIVIEAEICRDMLADFGFDIEYVPVDANVLWSSMEQSKHMMVFTLVAASIFEAPDPWSAYNCTYNYPYGHIYSGLGLKDGEPYIIKDSKGVSHDVGKIIADLRAASTNEELKSLTQEMAALTNDICPFTTVYEDTDVMRIYDPKIRYILKGYDNFSPLVVYDDYTELRGGPGWSLRLGKLYKVK
jgi:peptide/nickel transport system substrate-binding protein